MPSQTATPPSQSQETKTHKEEGINMSPTGKEQRNYLPR